jgi:hypothetical protein
MMNTVWAVVREGKIVPVENIKLPDNTRALVTFLPEDDSEFWLAVSESALKAVWDNEEDDVYADLLKK